MRWLVAVRRLGSELGGEPEGPVGNWSDGPAWELPEQAEPPVSERSVKSAECTKAPRPRLGGGSAYELSERLVVRLSTERRAVQMAQSKELIKAGMCHRIAQPADELEGAFLRLRFPSCALHGDVTDIVRKMPPMHIVLPSI